MAGKVLAIALLLMTGLAAQHSHADGLELGAGVSRLSAEGAGPDVTFGTLHGSVGYKFGSGEGFFLTPEIRFGTGIKEDTVLGVDVDLNHFYGVNLRAGLDSGNTYFFVYPSYTNYKLKASAGPLSVPLYNWELGIGVGTGFNFSEQSAVEFSYEKIDDADALGITLRLRF
jgi:hypothetical protein